MVALHSRPTGIGRVTFHMLGYNPAPEAWPNKSDETILGHTIGNHTLMFLSLSFSLPSPLSKNKQMNFFLKAVCWQNSLLLRRSQSLFY